MKKSYTYHHIPLWVISIAFTWILLYKPLHAYFEKHVYETADYTAVVPSEDNCMVCAFQISPYIDSPFSVFPSLLVQIQSFFFGFITYRALKNAWSIHLRAPPHFSVNL